MSATATSNEKFVEALNLLEQAAREKKADIQSLVENKYAALKDVILEKERSIRSQVQDISKRTIIGVKEAAQTGEQKAVELAKVVDESVHETPWFYIGGVAVAALLLGFVLGKKS